METKKYFRSLTDAARQELFDNLDITGEVLSVQRLAELATKNGHPIQVLFKEGQYATLLPNAEGSNTPLKINEVFAAAILGVNEIIR
ncbi:hypothetical protein KKE34_01975 [Patescibacteria group bacterium]|nr:hypothetical protein [Patescibacteria group bacterium]MBU1885353.1 hypothetical protein [Patescibacteria group bacterium]